jgi:Family of unknown function (DUF6994)
MLGRQRQQSEVIPELEGTSWMTAPGGFDPTFDFRTEASGDPDELSSTLREYHKRLWSKPLPSGHVFELEVIYTHRFFLHHLSSRGEFYLTSDSAMQTWSRPEKWPEMQAVIAQIPEQEIERFLTVAHQIGGKVMFPVDSKPTINQARGMSSAIADRFDLTLECIRRFYLGETSPLEATLVRYAGFFELFEDFKGYTDFFLLQDLVSEDASRVEFLIEFKDFSESPYARTVEEYQRYRENGVSFVQSRNRRMAEYIALL